ncbi:MAG: SDR family oxidoreductase [Rectinemataceae bacterium]|nr:SDR family oxidoreductase [Rectinemataceae bacterium]
MDLGLEGKVVFASASTDGLGFGIAEKALADGALVFIGGRSKERLDAALDRMAQAAAVSGGRAAGGVLDMASAESIEAWVAAGKAVFGDPDALLVNAGGPPPGNFEALAGDEPWQVAFNLTLMSAVRLIRAALPSLKAKKGSILTITSSSVKEPWPGLILSGVMRSGVASLVKSLSIELAPYGVRVNNIAPGNIMTGRLERLIASEAKAASVTWEKRRAERQANIPLGRIGEVEEFGRAGAFLLSPAASYLSGQTLLVDGGASKFLY